VQFKAPNPGTASLPVSREGMDAKVLAERPRATADRVIAAPTFEEPAGSKHDYDQVVTARIALDVLDNAYVTGNTRSTDFPLGPAAWQPTFGGGLLDSFVAKLNGTGSDLFYASFLGGSSADFASGIAVDATANAYVTGFTVSLNFPGHGWRVPNDVRR
jgi:hypothetical protein